MGNKNVRGSGGRMERVERMKEEEKKKRRKENMVAWG